MPFVVKNGLASFYQIIFQFVEEENLSNMYAYLDDVTAAGST